MRTQVVGLGGGGHAKVVIEILQSNNDMELCGLLDSNPELRGGSILGFPILGDDQLLPELAGRGVKHFFVGVGTTGDTGPRRRIYDKGIEHGMTPINAIHRSSIISESCQLGAGVTIMAGAVINACARLGANVIVNTGAIVEHDCVLQDHVHVATGAQLAGNVQVGAMSHIGAGATVRQGIRIGEGAIVAAGAVVINDVDSGATVAGVPARILKKQKR
jgi:sugar O-acyltransferase (sialic acid O-acetyltransferase NeuD family)